MNIRIRAPNIETDTYRRVICIDCVYSCLPYTSKTETVPLAEAWTSGGGGRREESGWKGRGRWEGVVNVVFKTAVCTMQSSLVYNRWRCVLGITHKNMLVHVETLFKSFFLSISMAPNDYSSTTPAAQISIHFYRAWPQFRKISLPPSYFLPWTLFSQLFFYKFYSWQSSFPAPIRLIQ
jgi:hypothetical protein